MPSIAQHLSLPSIIHHPRFMCSSNPDGVSIDVLSTPNPDALKFLLDREVTGKLRTISFKREDLEQKTQIVSSQLPGKLLAIPGVESLLLGFDFVTVQKEEEIDWHEIEKAVVEEIQKVASAQPSQPLAILQGVAEEGTEIEKDGELMDRIRELMDEKVVPNVQADGGDVRLRGFRNGTVWVSMVGACATCPSSTVTVRFMIRNLLTHYFPEVEDVRAIGEEEDVTEEMQAHEEQEKSTPPTAA